MIKLAAAPEQERQQNPVGTTTATAVREVRDVTNDDRLSLTGVYAFDIEKADVTEAEDGMVWTYFTFIEGTDGLWRGQNNQGRAYKDYRKRIRDISPADRGFATLQELLAYLVEQSLTLWRALGSDEHVDQAVADLEQFDIEAFVAEREAKRTGGDENQIEGADASEPFPEPDEDDAVDEPTAEATAAEQEPASEPTTEPTSTAEPSASEVAPATEAPATVETVAEVKPVEPKPAAKVQPATPVDPEAERRQKIEDWRRELSEAKESVCQAALAVVEMEARHKAAKKSYDAAVEHLGRVAISGPEDRPLLFQGQGADAVADEPCGDEGDNDDDNSQADERAEPTAEATAVAVDDSAWRAVTTEQLGLPPGIVKTLADEAGINTLGELADWTASGKRLTEIAKVGEGKAEKIEQACENYWKTHARPVA